MSGFPPSKPGLDRLGFVEMDDGCQKHEGSQNLVMPQLMRQIEIIKNLFRLTNVSINN